MRFGYLVILAPPFGSTVEKPAVLHQSQMLRGQMAGDFTRLSEFTHGVLRMEHHLHHAETYRMPQCPQAVRGLLQGLEINQSQLCVRRHGLSIYRKLATLQSQIWRRGFAGSPPLTWTPASRMPSAAEVA